MVWFSNPLRLKVKNFPGVDFHSRMMDLSSLIVGSEWALVLMLVWALWNNRNEMLFGGVKRDPQLIIWSAYKLLQEYNSALEGSAKDGGKESNSWVPPIEGVYKLNVDGVVFAETGSVGIGVVVRDFEGQPIATASKRMQGQFPIELVEAMAIRFATWFRERPEFIQGDH
ncbi:hypothetical protein L1049_015096 [Liquidambar formosana]|uniref:RNase H type-1 domain-containing protein n=1 Tax=Liquidambar formosana TaxID=63359 RepID=A0AAP0RYF2_LIQFO